MDPAGRLAAAIVAHAHAAGVPARLVALDIRPWASATFVGERHRIVLAAAPSPVRAAWLAALPETEIAVAHHVLVDLSVAGAAHPTRVVLETLLIEEG